MEQPCAVPTLPGSPSADGSLEECLKYRVFPRPKHKFKTTLDAHALFGAKTGSGEALVRVTTRVEPENVRLTISTELQGVALHEVLDLDRTPGMVARRLHRTARTAEGLLTREHMVMFQAPPYALPKTTYPEVMTPFLMRGEPRLKKGRRSLYCWTNDGFCARVYYEDRGVKTVHLKDGTSQRAHEVWMYPDLNDWIAMGGAVTRLAKPLLPRYTMWYGTDDLQRLVRFEGPYGPPGAPEVILELIGEA